MLLPWIYNAIAAAAAGDQVRPGLDRSGYGAGIVQTVPSFLRVVPGPLPSGFAPEPRWPGALAPALLKRVGIVVSYAFPNSIATQPNERLGLGRFELESAEFIHWASDTRTNASGGFSIPSWNHVLASMVWIDDRTEPPSPVRHWRKAWWTFFGRFGFFSDFRDAVNPDGAFYGDFGSESETLFGSVRDPEGGYHPLHGGRFWLYENPQPFLGVNAGMPRYVDVSPWTP